MAGTSPAMTERAAPIDDRTLVAPPLTAGLAVRRVSFALRVTTGGGPLQGLKTLQRV
jgi:hypothetical protein